MGFHADKMKPTMGKQNVNFYLDTGDRAPYCRKLKIYTHYYSSNFIWRTVSRRVDELISSDHTRRKVSSVIRWYQLILFCVRNLLVHTDMFRYMINSFISALPGYKKYRN